MAERFAPSWRLQLLIFSAMVMAFGAATAGRSEATSLDCNAAERYSAAHSGLAILAIQNGERVCASGPELDIPHEIYSGTKSFVGLAAAAAVQDGLLALDDRVSDTLTEWRGDPKKAQATIRQLLSMSAGLPSQVGRPPTFEGAVLAPFNSQPGLRFQYGPAPIQAFGELLKRKLAEKGLDSDPLRYMQRRLFGPMGLKYANWRRDAEGEPLMPQGAVLTAQEWAKVGALVLAKGRVGSRPIVDPVAFEALFQPSLTNPSYGLTWWLPHGPPSADPVTRSIDIGAAGADLPADMVVAAGAGDQRLYVIPSQGLVIVRMARLDIAAFMAGRPAPASPERWSDTQFLHILIGDSQSRRP